LAASHVLAVVFARAAAGTPISLVFTCPESS
jgi:hypothetical protein